jgi:hypothetical protein
MEEDPPVLLNTSQTWEQTHTLYKKKNIRSLALLWAAAAWEARSKLYFFNVGPESWAKRTKYTSELSEWWAYFNTRMHRTPPPISDNDMTSGMKSLLDVFVETLDILTNIIRRWIELHARTTQDIMRVVDSTNSRLEGIQRWFRAIAEDWRTQQPQPNQEARGKIKAQRSAFLKKYLPASPSEEVQCFARSDCMRAVAMCMQDGFQEAADIDLQVKKLQTSLETASSDHALRVVQGCKKSMGIAVSRTKEITQEEGKELMLKNEWATTVRMSLTTAAAAQLTRLRQLAHTAAQENVVMSTQMHDRVEWEAKKWKYINDQTWMPPVRVQ